MGKNLFKQSDMDQLNVARLRWVEILNTVTEKFFALSVKLVSRFSRENFRLS